MYLQASSIAHRLSYPYTPQQNGLAERKHRHLIELGLAMMFQSHIPLHYWVETFHTSRYIGNLLSTVESESKKKSPYKMLLRNKPDYSSLRVFGSACFPCLRPVTEHKFEPRFLKCVFLGYGAQYKGYRCPYPPTCKVYITRHAVFDEALFPFKLEYKSMVPKYKSAILRAWQMATKSLEEPPEMRITRLLPPPVPTTPPPRQPPTNIVVPPEVVHDHANSPEPPVDVAASPEHAIVPFKNIHLMKTRGKSGIQKPNTRYVLLDPKYDTSLPKDSKAAMAHPGWNGAVSEEMGTIHMLHTWTLVPYTEHMNVLSSRWVSQ